MHIGRLLFGMAQDSNGKVAIVLPACLCTAPFSSLWRLLPELPSLSVKAIVGVEGRYRRWAPGSQTVSHTLLIGSYRPLGDNKNTPSSLRHPASLHLSLWLYWQPQPLFLYNDIILIGEATVGLHLLELGAVIRQRRVMLIRVARGKEPLTRPGQTGGGGGRTSIADSPKTRARNC